MNHTLCKVVIFFLFILHTTYGQTCDPDSKPKTDSQRIKEKLLCTHDKYTWPGLITKNTTTILVYLSPITIEYDDITASLRMQTWLELFWYDNTFQWDNKQYNNTPHVVVDADKIWIPDLSLVNWKEDAVHVDKACSTVTVGYEGWLYASIIPVLSSHCVPDWSKWPFDIQTCEFMLISRQYLGHEVDFVLLNDNDSPKGLYMENFIPSRVWQLVDHKAERVRTTYGAYNGTEIFGVHIKIAMTIKRHASVLVSSYVMPGFVMMLLSLALLWFNPFTSQRIPLICVLILLQSLFMQYLAYKIPSNGPKTPGIVIFYGGSLVITTFLMLLTMLTRSMCSWVSRPPWLSTILNLLHTNKILQLILITDIKTCFQFVGDENEESFIKRTKDQGNKEWFELALALNRITFTILVPIYFVLFLHFIV